MRKCRIGPLVITALVGGLLRHLVASLEPCRGRHRLFSAVTSRAWPTIRGAFDFDYQQARGDGRNKLRLETRATCFYFERHLAREKAVRDQRYWKWTMEASEGASGRGGKS